MKNHLIYNIIFISLFYSGNIVSQRPVSLEFAMKTALENNAQLRSEAKWVEYQQALVNTSKSFEPTQFNAELGQFNSAFFDTGFGISQSFQLPGVYKKRTDFHIEKVKSAEAYVKMTEAEIRQQLDGLFAEYWYLDARLKLLNFQDSLYSNFLRKAELRWQKGETDILEKTTAEQQKLNITKQLIDVDKMKKFLLTTLNRIINDGNQYIPAASDFSILKYNIFIDSVTLLSHPTLLAATQELMESKAATSLQKMALFPDFNVAYRNVGIRGTGADNKFYNGSDRFSSVQIGIGIPVFRKGIRSAIHGAEMFEDLKMQEYSNKMLDIKSRIQHHYVMYNETMRQINTFEQTSLPNAKTIRTVSDKKFAKGEINYLEYVMLTNQAIQIESEYLDLIRSVNESIIHLYYLTNNF
jgi:cobalt-zinc-cadmium resistance protein CzcA